MRTTRAVLTSPGARPLITRMAARVFRATVRESPCGSDPICRALIDGRRDRVAEGVDAATLAEEWLLAVCVARGADVDVQPMRVASDAPATASRSARRVTS